MTMIVAESIVAALTFTAMWNAPRLSTKVPRLLTGLIAGVPWWHYSWREYRAQCLESHVAPSWLEQRSLGDGQESEEPIVIVDVRHGRVSSAKATALPTEM